MDVSLLKSVLQEIVTSFSIVYVDFNSEEYRPYKDRGIGGVVRFDEGRILFDTDLPPEEEYRTWAHEVLSIYYYWLLGIIRHDDEVEMEARLLCEDKECLSVLRQYKRLAKQRVIPE